MPGLSPDINARPDRQTCVAGRRPARARPRPAGGQTGFSLIELLVVILILGILATLAIPRFLGQRDGANDSHPLNNVRIALAAAADYEIGPGRESFTGLTAATITATEPNLSTQLPLDPSGTPYATMAAAAAATAGPHANPRNLYIASDALGTPPAARVFLCAAGKGRQIICARGESGEWRWGRSTSSTQTIADVINTVTFTQNLSTDAAPPPPPAPPAAFVAATNTSGALTAGGSGTVTIPAGVAVGDLLFAYATKANWNGTWAGPPAGWTAIRNNYEISSQMETSIFYKIATAADTAGTVLTLPTGATTAQNYHTTMAAYRGVSASSPLIGHAITGFTASATSFTVNGASVVPASDALLITLYISRQGVTWTPPAGYAEDAEHVAASHTSELASRNVSAGALGSMTATTGSSSTYTLASVYAFSR